MLRTGSMLKYFEDKGGAETEHGAPLHWPGTPSGFPYRGETAPLLKQKEVEEIDHALDYHSRLFRLWIPEEKEAFDAVMDRIVNGWYMQHRRTDREIPGEVAPAVWLEWVQIYGESPLGKHPGRMQDANNTTITLHEGSRAFDPAAGRQQQPARS